MSRSELNRGGRPEPITHLWSHAPVTRQEHRNNQYQVVKTTREADSREMTKEKGRAARQYTDPRWDPMTGELTSSSVGRPSQVKPAQYAQGLGISSSNPAASHGDMIDKHKPAVRQAEPLALRPAWNGASGRTTIFPPVEDTSAASPLRVPPRRGATQVGSISPPVGPETGRYASLISDSVDATSSGASNPPQLAHHRHVYGQQNNTYPISQAQPAPACTPEFAPEPRHGSVSSHAAHATDHGAQLKLSADKQYMKQYMSAVESLPNKSWSSSAYGESTVAPLRAPRSASNAAMNQPDDDAWTQPPSRFSVTTYAPSTLESPRLSQDIDAPSLPIPSEQHASVLDRSRPQIGVDTIGAKDIHPIDRPIVISIKSPELASSSTRTETQGSSPAIGPMRPRTEDGKGQFALTASIMTGALSDARRANSASPTPAAHFRPASKERRLSISSTNKDLPPVPPEIELGSTGDRVAILNQKLKVLGNRRINILRGIKQMTELMPTDSLMASVAVLAKRDVEKKKIEMLKEELADVQKEEHELGLKLHRAYKRLDREASYESATLWVRRATES